MALPEAYSLNFLPRAEAFPNVRPHSRVRASRSLPATFAGPDAVRAMDGFLLGMRLLLPVGMPVRAFRAIGERALLGSPTGGRERWYGGRRPGRPVLPRLSCGVHGLVYGSGWRRRGCRNPGGRKGA